MRRTHIGVSKTELESTQSRKLQLVV